MLRQSDDAVAARKKALSVCKKTISLNPNDADAYFNIGCTYELLKKDALALAAFEKAIALEPAGKGAEIAREAIQRLRKQ